MLTKTVAKRNEKKTSMTFAAAADDDAVAVAVVGVVEFEDLNRIEMKAKMEVYCSVPTTDVVDQQILSCNLNRVSTVG